MSTTTACLVGMFLGAATVTVVIWAVEKLSAVWESRRTPAVRPSDYDKYAQQYHDQIPTRRHAYRPDGDGGVTPVDPEPEFDIRQVGIRPEALKDAMDRSRAISQAAAEARGLDY